jgi:Mg/Co/Ni transporter MgtE
MIALAKTIETLLENKKYSSLRDVLSSMNEADIAAMFSEVSSDSLPLLFCRKIWRRIHSHLWTLMSKNF